MAKLLVIDDEPLICQSFRWVFSTGEVEVLTAGTVAEGLRRIDEDQPDVIVLDYQLPDGTGLDLFDQARGTNSRRPVIFLTARGTTETAMEAMRRGAFDYLDKPFDLEQMTELLTRAFDAARRRGPISTDEPDGSEDKIIGRSPLILEISKQVGRVAPLDVTVLIRGESGTGKELVARAIRRHSQRANKPFLAINCAAIPEGLVESELFGHELGAFTGAVERRIGRFEHAEGGTLFLDEIGDMPAVVQAKILRFLQDQTFERVGGRNAIRTHVRVIAATNQNLEQRISEGGFRSDLYYRLKEMTIQVPPLRDRLADVPELAQHFLSQFVHETGREIQELAPETLSILQRYAWPGNVRELRGVIREAAVQTTGRTLLTGFLPAWLREAADFQSVTAPQRVDILEKIDAMLEAGETGLYYRVVGVVERELFTRVLRHTGGHLGQACERLGIDRKTLRNKLREFNLDKDA